METVESAEETFRKIIGPNWNKKETLKIKHVCTNCKAIFETATELDKHTNGEKVNAGEYISVSENASVKFNRLSLLNPALDVKPENSGIMLVVPMPGIRTRDVHDKQGKVVDTKKTSDIIQCVVTDEREMFEAEDEAFVKRGWVARIPSPIIEQRWTPRSLQEFLYGSPQEINPASLYEKIKAKFDFYIDFGESKGASEFCALYTMLSYFYPLFEYVPYFKLGGEKGVAKTKCGNIFAALGFNGDIFANASAASIYRMAQDTRGIMVIDEAEGLAFKSEERQAYQDVLNSGWQRNGNVPRTNKDTMRVERLGTFCPKVICSIGGLYDVLEDRAFEVILLKTLDSEKGSREVGRSSLEWKPIRDELYLCLMQYWKQIQEMQIQNKFEILVDKSAFWKDVPEEWRALHDESIKRIHGENVKTTYWLDFQLPGRLWNLCKPIMTMAALVDTADPKLNVMDALTGFIYSKMLDKDSKVEATLTASVIEALEQVLKAMDPSKNYLDMREVVLGEVVDKVREIEGDDARNAQGEFWIKPKTVAAVLRNLNLYSKTSKSHGKMKFVVTDKAVEETKARLSFGLKIGGRGGDDTAENRELALLWAGSQGNSIKKFNLPSFIPHVTQSIKPMDSEKGRLSVLTGVTSPISPDSEPIPLMRDIPPPDSKDFNIADALSNGYCKQCDTLVGVKSISEHMKLVHQLGH